MFGHELLVFAKDKSLQVDILGESVFELPSQSAVTRKLIEIDDVRNKGAVLPF